MHLGEVAAKHVCHAGGCEGLIPEDSGRLIVRGGLLWGAGLEE